MDVTAYYAYQAEARGLRSFDDVLRALEHVRGTYQAILQPWLPPSRTAVVREVGCGPGILLAWLRSLGYLDVAGSDAAPVQIDLARAGGLDATLGDSIELMGSWPDASVDCLLGLDFYEHLPKEVLLDFMHEAARVLRPGGRLILRGPNGDSPVLGRALYNDITHVTALTSVAMTACLRMAGFGRVEFADDTLASIRRRRWLLVPVAWAAQRLVRAVLRAATREDIRCLSSSSYLCAER